MSKLPFLEISGKMSILIVCLPACNIINLKIYISDPPIFLQGEINQDKTLRTKRALKALSMV